MILDELSKKDDQFSIDGQDPMSSISAYERLSLSMSKFDISTLLNPTEFGALKGVFESRFSLAIV